MCRRDRNDLWQYDPLNGQWAWISGAEMVNQVGGYSQEPPEASSLPGGVYGGVSRTDGWGRLGASEGQSTGDGGRLGSLDAELLLPDGLQPIRPRLTPEPRGLSRK